MRRTSQMSLANSASTGSGRGSGEKESRDAAITVPPGGAGSSEAVPASAPMLLVTPRRWDAHRVGTSRKYEHVQLVLGAVLGAIRVWPGWLKNCVETGGHGRQFPFSFVSAETSHRHRRTPGAGLNVFHAV